MVITARLLHSAAQKSRLMQYASEGQRSAAKELKASVTVLTLALLQCAVYFPSSVMCMLYCFANESDMPIAYPRAFADLVVIYNFAYLFCTVAHCWNFFVYLTKVHSFRSELMSLLHISDIYSCRADERASQSNYSKRSQNAISMTS